MTTFYLDTEFNGFGGQLLSLALVSQEDVWYEINEQPKVHDPWVKQHVVPVLGGEPLCALIFKSQFQQFIKQYDNPTIICDWHADAQHFCQMLAGFDYGSSLDFAFNLQVVKTPPGQPISAIPHNALADAKALMDWHMSLRQEAS